MSDPIEIEQFLEQEAQYKLMVDPLAVTSAELGAIINALTFILNQQGYDNMPQNVRKFFVKVA